MLPLESVMHRALRTRIGAWEGLSDKETKFIVHTVLANPAKLSRLVRQRKGQPRHHSELSPLRPKWDIFSRR